MKLLVIVDSFYLFFYLPCGKSSSPTLPEKEMLKLSEKVLAGVTRYALTSTTKLKTFSSDGQRHFNAN